MNEDKQKELLKALKLIKDICLKSKSCYECPLRTNETDPKCYLYRNTQNEWEYKVEDFKEGKWMEF